MVIDWDDLLSYTTTRSVTVRHRYLGLTYYSLLTAVLVYIFVIQIGFQKKYNVQLDVDGSIQANVQGVGAAALRPLSELDYCNRTYVDGHVYECVYPELATGVLAKVGPPPQPLPVPRPRAHTHTHPLPQPQPQPRPQPRPQPQPHPSPHKGGHRRRGLSPHRHAAEQHGAAPRRELRPARRLPLPRLAARAG